MPIPKDTVYVDLQSDEMLGRIVGRNGRNLAALREATGTRIGVHEGWGLAVVTCADAQWREIAYLTVKMLVEDGRIHPVRIKETVRTVKLSMATAIKKVENAKGLGLLCHFATVPSPAVKARAMARLRSLVGSGVEDALATIPAVDLGNRRISNVAVMSEGPATGHGFSIDSQSLQQLHTILKRYEPRGVPMRFHHPADPTEDALGSEIAYLVNPRMTNYSGLQQVRGDVQFLDDADILASKREEVPFLLRKANEDPESFGLSAVITFDAEPVYDRTGLASGIVARIDDCFGCDFVSKPAANRRGLLGSNRFSVIANSEVFYATTN